MEKYNYREAVIEDIRNYIKDNDIKTEGFDSRDEMEEYLNDTLWTEDSVTGNASGSYYMSRWQAEEALCHNWELINTVIDEWETDIFDPEVLDCTIRCYLLGECIAKVLDELEQDVYYNENHKWNN